MQIEIEKLATGLFGALVVIGGVFMAIVIVIDKVRDRAVRFLGDWTDTKGFADAVAKAQALRAIEEAAKMESMVRTMIERHDEDASAHMEVFASLREMLQSFRDEAMARYSAMHADVREINVKLNLRNGGGGTATSPKVNP